MAAGDWRVSLADARVMLINDDGVDAPGLKLLERLVRPLVRELWVVAPAKEESGTSHAFSIHRPVRMTEVGERRFAVDGMPADAAIIGLKVAMKDAPPDIVLSGVNRGANIGDDSSYSGTVGAAMEAAMAGVPAVAFSLNRAPRMEPKWPTVERHLVPTLTRLLEQSWPTGAVLNVNFPDFEPDAVKGFRVTRLGRRRPGGEIMHGVDPAGHEFYWIGTKRILGDIAPDSDVQAAEDGYISMTPLTFDLTDEALLDGARKRLGA